MSCLRVCDPYYETAEGTLTINHLTSYQHLANRHPIKAAEWINRCLHSYGSESFSCFLMLLFFFFGYLVFFCLGSWKCMQYAKPCYSQSLWHGRKALDKESKRTGFHLSSAMSSIILVHKACDSLCPSCLIGKIKGQTAIIGDSIYLQWAGYEAIRNFLKTTSRGVTFRIQFHINLFRNRYTGTHYRATSSPGKRRM